MPEIDNQTDIRIDDLVFHILKKAEAAQLFESSESLNGKKREVLKRLMNELLLMDKRISPEGVGLLSFHVPKPSIIEENEASIADQMGLLPHEIWPLIEVLLDSFRIQSAIHFPHEVDPRESLFRPRNRQGFMNLNHSMHKYNVFSWIPSEGKTNRRLDFLYRLFLKQGLSVETALEKAKVFLEAIWEDILLNIMKDYFIQESHPKAGIVYKMSYKHWSLTGKSEEWYQCSHCATWTTRNVQNVCPTLRCLGTLEKKDVQQANKDNHYYRLYKQLIPIRMNTKEHTAQLNPKHAADYQQKFIQNEINVLSCSTTFEMGVDVGDLEAVFMRNVPPETSNYIQRAGRAGRRTSSTAFALTFAQRKSHDLSFFQHPEKMMAGEVRPPIFKIENEKIVRRHVHSVALAAFFKKYPSYFKTVEDFFRLEHDNIDERGMSLLINFLSQKPVEIEKSLERIIPNEIKQDFGIKSWNWVNQLVSAEDSAEGILNKAYHLYEKDLYELKEVRERLIEEEKESDYIVRMIKTIKERQLIAFLSSHNVLPKYGFPVDVVELQIIQTYGLPGNMSRLGDLPAMVNLREWI